MMHVIFSSYIPLLLLFMISFSSKSQNYNIEEPFLENQIVPFIAQPTPIKLYGYFIYPSNDKFKNDILPFLSSEILLKIYFHFQNLYPNLSIEKFLPDSRFRLKTTVLDLEKSYYPAYIFKNEFSCFNPIIFDSEQNYRTVTLGRPYNTEDGSIYALFSSNTIYSFDSYDLPHNRNIFAAFDLYSEHFLAAEKNTQEKLTAIAYGKNPNLIFYGSLDIDFSDYLNFILKAQNLSRFKKFYFKIFDLYIKYGEYLLNLRWFRFVLNTIKEASFCQFGCTFLVSIYVVFFPVYHALMLPFYILSFPFEFFLFQNNFVFSSVWIITKNFVSLWTIPCAFFFISYLSYFKLNLTIYKYAFGDLELKPHKIKWVVPYLIGKQHLSYSKECIWLKFLTCFGLGLIYTLPFLPFLMIHGEANE